MVNVIVSDEEYRIYTISPENKLMQIRNMTRNFVNNSVELNRDEVSKIVKNEYGEEIEIKSIELTQTKLNVLISEGIKEEYDCRCIYDICVDPVENDAFLQSFHYVHDEADDCCGQHQCADDVAGDD